MVIVAALYQFKNFPDYMQHREPLQVFMKENGVKGSILIGSEGINGTVSSDRSGLDALKNYLENTLDFDDLEYKESTATEHPFFRTKVKIKKEICTIGVDGVNPCDGAGAYLNPQEWNNLLDDPDTILIDTRNDYELRVGTFKGAIDPNIKRFTDFPAYIDEHKEEWKDKKIAMFCTGGIRCEKSTALMRKIGFDNVYHLKGGILKYLEEIPVEKSKWEGACYVFDQRVAVGHGLALTDYTSCGACREPLNTQDRESSLYEEGVSCPYCHGKRTAGQIKAARDRQFQVDLAKKRGTQHIGASR